MRWLCSANPVSEATFSDRDVCASQEHALVKDEGGVIKIHLGRKKEHTVYSVPESVAKRIHTRCGTAVRAPEGGRRARYVPQLRATLLTPDVPTGHWRYGT